MKDIITDLAAIAQIAAEKHDAFEVMCYMLQLDDDLDDGRLDHQIDELAAPIIAAIDCTQCANCCRHLDVYLTPHDTARLAAGVHISLDELDARHIEHAEANSEGEWGKFRAKPCAFLQGKLCSVYAHRPETCRLYPQFTPDFRWVLDDLIGGAALCPIIYNVLAEVTAQVDEIIKNP